MKSGVNPLGRERAGEAVEPQASSGGTEAEPGGFS